MTTNAFTPAPYIPLFHTENSPRNTRNTLRDYQAQRLNNRAAHCSSRTHAQEVVDLAMRHMKRNPEAGFEAACFWAVEAMVAGAESHSALADKHFNKFVRASALAARVRASAYDAADQAAVAGRAAKVLP